MAPSAYHSSSTNRFAGADPLEDTMAKRREMNPDEVARAMDLTDEDQDALRELELDIGGDEGRPADAERLSNDVEAEESVSADIAHIRNAIMKSEGTLVRDDTWQRVICMRMGPEGRNTAALHSVPTENGLMTIKFKPFQRSRPLHPKYVQAVTRTRTGRRFGIQITDFAVEPPREALNDKLQPIPGTRGDCKGRLSFKDPNTGTRVMTCPYGDCPRHPLPQGIYHSIWQAQNFISHLRSDSVIREYVRRFDPRPEVAAFAQLVIDYRVRTAMEATGLGSGTNKTLVF